MMRLIFILFAALFCSTQSSALLGGPRIVHGGTSPSKSVMLNVRGGERVAMNQNFQSLKMANNGDDSNYAKKTSKLDKMLGWYNYQLEKRPAVTKILSSGVIGAVGDILSQLLVQRKTASLLDWRSVAVFATVCGLYFAPVLDVWFAFLGRVSFPKSWSDTGRAAAMTVVDQTVGAALVTSGFFFAFELVQRALPPYLASRPNLLLVTELTLRRKLFSTIKASWCCWPFINFINFKFVPAPYRVLFSNVAAVFWNMYLAAVARSP